MATAAGGSMQLDVAKATTLHRVAQVFISWTFSFETECLILIHKLHRSDKSVSRAQHPLQG